VNRRTLMLLGALVVLVIVVFAVAWHSLAAPPANRLLVAGDVRAVVRTVSAPAISYPNADYSVSVPSNATAGQHVATIARTTPRSMGAATFSRQPVVSGRLTHVYVRAGDHVKTGEVLARLDTTLLELGIRQAKTNATRARIQVRVIKNNLDTVIDNQEKLDEGWDQIATGKAQIAAGKTQISSGKSQLTKAKAGLLATQKQLQAAKRNKPQLEAQLAALKQQAAGYPAGHVPASLQKKIAQLERTLASINPGLAQVAAGLKQVNSGLAQLATASSALATAEGQLATATGQLVSAGDALRTAKKQLIRARDSLTIMADAQHILISLAFAKREQATVTAPVDGVVTQAAAQGTIAMVGTPIARIIPAERELVDTYLTGAQLAQLHPGTTADITYDSSGGKSLPATLSLVNDQALFPPTSFPTDLVHMTRAVKVTFRLDSGASVPPGTPVDVAIHTD
jgi:X-X-X-Leu-X-X-Gly heptad repeat protein